MFGERIFEDRWWTLYKSEEIREASKRNYPTQKTHVTKVFCNASDIVDLKEASKCVKE